MFNGGGYSDKSFVSGRFMRCWCFFSDTMGQNFLTFFSNQLLAAIGSILARPGPPNLHVAFKKIISEVQGH